MGSKPFRARQLMNWMYKRGEGDITAMTDLAKDFRAELVQRAEVAVPEIVKTQIASDGTRKWLLSGGNGQAFEMVYIPEKTAARCASLRRWAARSTARSARPLSRVSTAISPRPRSSDRCGWRIGSSVGRSATIASSPTSCSWAWVSRSPISATWCRPSASSWTTWGSISRVAASRCPPPGLVPQIYKLAEEVNCALAVSLHAPNDELRSQLVPINRKHNIAELLEASWHYLDEQNGRSVTFEYVMLDGINDQPEHARELAKLLRDKPAKLNLIPFNPYPGTPYRRSPQAAIEKFRDELMQRGLIVTIRKTRGDDIDAACGQLAGQVTDRTIVRLGSKTFGLQVRA
jgi:23S rRNA (adenine2503-C2)-methyltransferase